MKSSAIVLLTAVGLSLSLSGCVPHQFSKNKIEPFETASVTEESSISEAEYTAPSISKDETPVVQVNSPEQTDKSEQIEMEVCLGRALAADEIVSCRKVEPGKISKCNLMATTLFLDFLALAKEDDSIVISKRYSSISSEMTSNDVPVGEVTLLKSQARSLRCLILTLNSTVIDLQGSPYELRAYEFFNSSQKTAVQQLIAR